MQKYQAQQRERSASKTGRLAERQRRPPRVFVFGLQDRVRIGGYLFTKSVQIMKCSSQRMFQSRGTTVLPMMFGAYFIRINSTTHVHISVS